MTLTAAPRSFWNPQNFSIDTVMARSSWLTATVSVTANQAWGTANRAIYIPIRVPRLCTVVKLAFGNGSTATGNYDIGLYNAAGTRLVSKGSTAKGVTQEMTVVDVADTTISAGTYYLALNSDSTTDTFMAIPFTAPTATARGALQQAVGAVTLPSTATFALDHTLAFWPVISALLSTVPA